MLLMKNLIKGAISNLQSLSYFHWAYDDDCIDEFPLNPEANRPFATNILYRIWPLSGCCPSKWAP